MRAIQAWKIDPRGNKYDAQFTELEKVHGLPSGLLRRVAWQESRFNDAAKSPAGAVGLFQFMPATAKEFGINPLSATQSAQAAAKYLEQLYKRFGNWSDALASYNWGQGNVAKKGRFASPKETQKYFASITADLGIG